jgi:hypothetical protein
MTGPQTPPVPQTHTETENDPWTINVGDHPQRTDSPAYTRSRNLMVKLVQLNQPWFLGDPPYQDHHGGGIWVKDDTGWLLLLGLAGIEWSAQFCADPAKVDLLRRHAKRIVAAFPQTIPGYVALGYTDAAGLLATPITTTDQIAAWTDGIFNASVPLPANQHTGVLPAAAGFHHYPKPIVDIELFKHDDKATKSRSPPSPRAARAMDESRSPGHPKAQPATKPNKPHTKQAPEPSCPPTPTSPNKPSPGSRNDQPMSAPSRTISRTAVRVLAPAVVGPAPAVSMVTTALTAARPCRQRRR